MRTATLLAAAVAAAVVLVAPEQAVAQQEQPPQPPKGTPGLSCASLSSCDSCAAVDFCGWCPGENRCVHASKSPCADMATDKCSGRHFTQAAMHEAELKDDTSLPGKVVAEAEAVGSLAQAQAVRGHAAAAAAAAPHAAAEDEEGPEDQNPNGEAGAQHAVNAEDEAQVKREIASAVKEAAALEARHADTPEEAVARADAEAAAEGADTAAAHAAAEAAAEHVHKAEAAAAVDRADLPAGTPADVRSLVDKVEAKSDAANRKLAEEGQKEAEAEQEIRAAAVASRVRETKLEAMASEVATKVEGQVRVQDVTESTLATLEKRVLELERRVVAAYGKLPAQAKATPAADKDADPQAELAKSEEAALEREVKERAAAAAAAAAKEESAPAKAEESSEASEAGAEEAAEEAGAPATSEARAAAPDLSVDQAVGEVKSFFDRVLRSNRPQQPLSL